MTKSNRTSPQRVAGMFLLLALMFSLFLGNATAQRHSGPLAVCPGWSITEDVRTAIDLNRDGNADLAAFDNGDYSPSHSALWTAINSGNGTFTVQKAVPNLDAANAGQPSDHLRMLVDLNGDHVPDIVIFGDAGVWTALSQQNARVSSLVSTATSGATPVLPPTLFGAPQLVLQNFGVKQGWDPSKLRFVADLNHDGFADIIGFGDDGVWTALGKGDGTFGPVRPGLATPYFGAQQGWSPTSDVILLADLNHDGYPDIVGFGSQGVWTAMSNRDGTFANAKLGLPNYFGSAQGWTPAKHVRTVAVLNTVGLADIIAFGDQGVWTALGNGDGTFQTPKLVLENFGVAQGWEPAKHVRLMADLNHDGLDDIVAFGDAGVWTALSAGHGTLASPSLAVAGSAPQPHPPAPSELGAGTFETPNMVLPNFGVAQEWSPAKHIRLMADLNDDHYPDIVGFGDRGVWTALGKGDGTFQNPQFPLDYFACGGKFDFNLESTQTDLNGFPINPQWRWQVYNPSTPGQLVTPDAANCHYFSDGDQPSFSDCTDQTNSNNVNLPSGFPNANVCSFGEGYGFPGHLNWTTATFQAFHSADSEYGLSWGDHNIDDDYDMPLIVPGAPALINERSDLHTEFDASETMKYSHTPWWNEFHNAVDCNPPGPGCLAGSVLLPGTPIPTLLLHDADAILTGLFGVDCEHDGCKSELHPVYTFAAHVQDNPDNDVWAMFLRNTGDEGYCSSNMTQANFTNYTFRLPWRTEESVPWTSVDVLWDTTGNCSAATEAQAKSCFEQLVPPGGSTGPVVTYFVGRWVDVTFEFPAPDKRPHIDGELHLKWSRGPISGASAAASSSASSPSAPSPLATSGHVLSEEPDEAGGLRTAMDRLTPAQQSQIRKAVAAAIPSTMSLQTLPAGPPAREVTSEPPSHPAVRIGNEGPAATDKAARDAAMVRELCQASGESIAGAPPNLCAQAPH